MSFLVKIYCPKASARHHFIFKLFFEELLGSSYTIAHDIAHSDINYSSDKGGKIQCTPYGLLDQADIAEEHKKNVVFEKWKTSFAFYKTSSSSLPFDIFSAAFFLVSRYEEYLEFEPDGHDRFPAGASVLVQQGLIEEPLVNQWALILQKELLAKCDDLVFEIRKFNYLSTIDVDQAWKFRKKGFFRNVLGTLRDLKERKWENLKDRWPVLLGFKKDAFYEAFSWHSDLEKTHGFNAKYFILLGDYKKYDKNISHTNSQFQSLLKSLDSDASLGIHPSYYSNENSNIVTVEIKRLEKIVSRPITSSRQHFLMHKMPETYRTLITNSITEDHTMGYSTHLGFRAGIAAPFYWFDLESNKETNLKLVPFCAMDITPLHYREETPKQAIATLQRLMDKVKAVDGLFVSLWHNESLSETERWKGWRVVYEKLVAKAKSLQS